MDIALADHFRAKAKLQRDAANTLLGAGDFDTSAEKQVAATVGQVNANTLEALADLIEYQHATESGGSLAAKRRAILERNDAIRRAAARGQWDEFDRLTEIAADPDRSPSGGDGA